MAVRRRPLRTGGPKRQVTWVAPADQGFVSVGGGAKILVASFTPFAFGMVKPTVVRTRGEVSIKPSAFGVDVDIVGAYGMGVVSDQALAAGVTSIPGPWTDADWDGWFVWRSYSYHLEFTSGTGVRIISEQYTVDSKAMRKVSDNETVVIVAESQAVAFEISMPVRMLLKLS